MLKQRLISSLLLCAFVVLFAHTVIPHHHHGDETEQQHGSGGDNHDDLDNDLLGQAFAHLQHPQGSAFVYETATPDFQCFKVNIDRSFLFVVQYIVQVLYKPPIKHAEPPGVYITSSRHSVTNLLRGPPSLMG